MSDYLTAAIRRPEPKAWKALRFFAQAITFGVIEVLAALHLNGWLSWALWAIAVYNTLILILGVTGLALIATKAVREDADR